MISNYPKIKAFLPLFLCIFAVFFTACQRGGELSLSKMEPQMYKHITGYQISVPGDWLPAAQTAAGVYFIDDNNNISLNIISEMGGMDFYSPEELIQMVIEKLGSSLKDIKTRQILGVQDKKSQYGVVISGENASGEVIANTIWLYEPVNGIRYYLFFNCGGDDYTRFEGVFNEVIKSFRFIANDEEVFSLLNLDKEELDEKMKTGLTKVD